MELPIVAYGDPVLRKKAAEIEEDYPNLQKLIADMFDTMYAASGVGLAAPQIGLPIRLFIVDAAPFAEDDDEEEGDSACADFKRVFINPIIFEESGDEWGFEEGCLSIPGIREEVKRKEVLKIEYYDENWDLYEEELDGILARIVQHEYDHIEGVLFTDKISPLRRTLLKGKLADITKGKVEVSYKMRFPKAKRK
jgi:peptide deformylase